ncbi:MAG TPA: hypothetical protein VM617_08085 [Thermoanaerobaculia bacterium]|nr:hypothetical protein [Thermoanaerobaculia bacterium]
MIRVVLLLAAGGLGALAARALLPLPPGDPFRSTLALLPLVLAAFAALHHAGRLAGGRAIPRARRAWELPAVAALVAVVVARPQLDLPLADGVLAAGLAVVLFHRALLQLVALRPLLGRRVPRRPSSLFFFLPLVVYLAVAPWGTFHRQPDGDEPYYLLIAHSLAYDLDAQLTDDYADGESLAFLDRRLEPQPGDPVGPAGQLYSRHNELLPLALAPAYRLAGKAGALATMAALAALLAWATLRLARHYWPERPGEALLAYGLLALAPPLLVYSHQVWVEVPAALLSVLALDRILDPYSRLRWGRRHWLGAGLPILLLPLLKIRFMLLAVPLVALAWWHAGRPRKPLIVLSLALAAVAVGILVHNQVVFGNPLKIHQIGELELTDYPGSAYLLGTLGLFWDSAFGLFAAAPLWLLLLPAIAVTLAAERATAGRLPRPGDGGALRRWLLFDLVVFAVPYLLIVVPRGEWYGGWSPPFRYALIALPLLALTLVPLLRDRRRGGARVLVAALGLATLGLTLLWLVVPGWTYNFADGRTDLLDHLTAAYGADVARFFPSSLRPRPATWIWPLATVLLVPLLWFRPRRRLAAAASWGAAALLLAVAALPLAAGRLPTRVVHFEDPHVEKSLGGVYPGQWVIERSRYRGGWTLPEGSWAVVPVVAGGDRVSLRLVARGVENVPGRPVEIALESGRRRLGTVRLPAGGRWTEARLGPIEWRAGEPLTAIVVPQDEAVANGAVLDLVELEWR